ncbi:MULTISPECIES: chemotaxis protein CheW [unclassified Leptolyngbya]|uniref:chemotaxis protein CheW n=1 Tax=unclassified Leptolyngbya TaxID=2650499 RepID=UPI00168870E7|nr:MULTISPECIES: chemotaxis protein CheW [unclassified Leptolyngbya]MBD1909427.1 chemotaxis protein CheW [Leptolyngbya sp. FACHB-8]MBD2158591.1 chemotaxis protein CheW [Leptolyngbya sp. FACHB-16]
MMKSSSPLSREPAIASSPSVICQALTFQVQNYRFALPLGAIVRIVQGRSAQSSQRDLIQFHAGSPMQLFEGEPLPILDLRMALVEASSTLPLSSTADTMAQTMDALFLLIVRLPSYQCCGLAVDRLPKIQPLSLTQCRRLPEFYRHKIANLASHAVVQESETDTDTSILFLLDLQSLQSNSLATYSDWKDL